MTTDNLKRAGKRLANALVFHTGITASHASGARVTSVDGIEYLDFTSGLATTSVGHCHPAVVKAMRDQSERLIHSGCIFHYDAIVDLADRLAEITPEGIEMFFFSNSGAEAVEGAVKLARQHTGRQGIISFTGGFHGRTTGALSLTTSNSKYRAGYMPLLPSVFHSPYPYCYRCPVGRKPESCSVDCIDRLDEIFTHLAPAREIACAVIEPVLGEGGYVVPPPEFLQRLREICTREGILLVADEVQTGFGRTGKWFGCEHSGITPDIITLAKGIASGMPLSAIGSTTEIMKKWPRGAHGTTFGGNPVSCAASIATIDVIERDGLLERAATVGASALKRLGGMKERIPAIGDVRGLGYMIGIELVGDNRTPDARKAEAVIESALEQKLVLVECGTHKNIIRLMPPLVATAEDMTTALDIIEEALVG